MSKPPRTHQAGTFFITASCWDKHAIFRVDRNAQLLLDTLLHYRKHFALHEYVIMPDHFHLLLTTRELPIERVVQYIKGGFSHALSQRDGPRLAVWQRSFTNHRVLSRTDYDRHVHYIHQNPVKKHLCATPEAYPWSSAAGSIPLDPYLSIHI